MAKKPTIGLLGGSFNPAHEGHLYISKEAKKRLSLHSVWWLVAAQNPLKSRENMADFDRRYGYAKKLSQAYRYIKPCDYEKERGLIYTVDVLMALIKDYGHRYHFVFLMGADNYAQLHRWHRWREILDLMPIIVFPRNKNGLTHPSRAANYIKYHNKPVTLLSMRRYDLSASYLRQKSLW